MAKQVTGIDVYKKMKDLKTPSHEPSQAAPAFKASTTPSASGSKNPQAAKAVFSQLNSSKGQRLQEKPLPHDAINLKQLREEVHANVVRQGFTPPHDPSYFDRNESVGLVKQGLEIKGPRKAAKFLMLLGEEQAGAVLNQLTPSEVAILLKEMESLPPVMQEEVPILLREFKALKDKFIDPHGGIETARTILENALGVEKGRSFLQKVAPEAVEKPFSFLADAEVSQLYLLLKKESADVVALVLPNLPKKTSSGLLKSFGEEMQVEIVKKLAHRRKPSAMALTIIEERLQQNFRRIGNTKTEAVDGSGALANILKYLSPQMESEIIEDLRVEDPLLSRDVKDKLFTIDMIVNIHDQDLQTVLQDYSDVELAVILKGKSREIEDKIYKAVSERRADLIRYERELLGPMKREDVEKATKIFLNHLKKLQRQGEIRIIDSNENYV